MMIKMTMTTTTMMMMRNAWIMCDHLTNGGLPNNPGIWPDNRLTMIDLNLTTFS